MKMLSASSVATGATARPPRKADSRIQMKTACDGVTTLRALLIGFLFVELEHRTVREPIREALLERPTGCRTWR